MRRFLVKLRGTTADASVPLPPASACRRDQKGYVYEKESVMLYINRFKGQPVKNPNAGASPERSAVRLRSRNLAGVTAPLTAAELQPAKNVMRMARRKQLASQQVRRRGRHPSAFH